MSTRKRGAPSSLDELQAASASLKAEAELPTSSSTAPTNPTSATSSSSSSKRRESSSLHPRYSLSLQPQPPRHPFVGVYFPVQLFLVDAKKVTIPAIQYRNSQHLAAL